MPKYRVQLAKVWTMDLKAKTKKDAIEDVKQRIQTIPHLFFVWRGKVERLRK